MDVTTTKEKELSKEALTTLAMESFQRSPFAFIEETLGEVPQPIKPEYKDYVLALYTIPPHQFSEYASTIKSEMFEPFVKGKHLTWQQAIATIAIQRAVNGTLPRKIAIKAGRGTGKDISLEETVYKVVNNKTTAVKAREVKVGDTILGLHKPTKVVDVIPQPIKQLYRVTLDDGESCVVGLEHNWTVSDGQTRKKIMKRVGYKKGDEDGMWETIETKEMLRRGLRLWNKNPEKRFRLPIQSVEGFKKVPNAYIVGVWYGDGHKGTGRYTKPDEFVAEKIISLGYDLSKLSENGSRAIYGFKQYLTEIGADIQKEGLPKDFLDWDIESRKELLRGLMDTDGTCDYRGLSEFTTVIPKLAKDVQLLIRSLGGKTNIRIKEKTFYNDKQGERVYCKPAYRLGVTTTFNPFSLPRKAKMWHPPSQDRYLYRFVDSIETDESIGSVCYTVEAEDSLYLVGEGLIATHNSNIMSKLILWFLFSFPLSKIPCTAPTADQLFAVLWSEINLTLSNMKPEYRAMFEWETKFIRMKQRAQVWYARAKTASPGETGALSGVHCFEEGSVEVMTKDGFKDFKDISTKDYVFTRLGWEKPTEVIRKEYNGEMITQEGKLFSFSVTPNHRFPSVVRDSHYLRDGTDEWSEEQLIPVSDWKKMTVKVPRYIKNSYGKEVNSYHVPAYKNHYVSQPERKGFDVPMDAWVAFLGWYLSEGSCGQNNVSIAQSIKNKTKREEIAEVISKLGFTPSKGKTDVVLCNIQITEHIKKLCPGKALTKRIPEFLFNLSQRQMRIFLNAYRKGDGHLDKKSGRISYMTSSEGMADDLQRLILLSGGYATKRIMSQKGSVMNVGDRHGVRNSNCYTVREWQDSRNLYANSKGIQRNKKQYNGIVECLTVPSSMFYVRDKKTSHGFWTGNSDYMASFSDESYDVADEVFQVAEATQTGDISLMVLVGNAVHDHGYFYECFNKHADEWVRLTMNGEDSPIVNPATILAQEKQYGRNSNHYRASVLGEFPIATAIDVEGWSRMFSDDWLNDVMPTTPREGDNDLFDTKTVAYSRAFLGVDPAGEGTDDAVGYIRNATIAFPAFVLQTNTTRSIALTTINTIETYGLDGNDVTVDNFGIGAELAQEVSIQSNTRFNIQGVNTGNRPEDILDQSAYMNERARTYHALYWWGKRGGRIMYDEGLREELKTIFSRKNEQGRLQIMPKREMRKRGYRSPNKCDSLSLTFANDRMMGNYIPRAEFRAIHVPTQQKKPDQDFDPHNSIPDF